MSEETKTDSKTTTVTTIKENVSAGVKPRSDGHTEKVLQVVGTPQAAVDVAPVKPSGGEPTVTPSSAAKEAAVSKLISFEATKRPAKSDSNSETVKGA